MEVDDITIRVIASCITGTLPSSTDLLAKKEDKTMQSLIENCYAKGLKQWVANNSLKERVAQHKFGSITQLQALYNTNQWTEDAFVLNKIVVYWVEELHRDERCTSFIQKECIVGENEECNGLIDLLRKYNVGTLSAPISKGLTTHQAVDGYIRRHCSLESSNDDFVAYFIGSEERHILADFVVGLRNASKNKYILYSSAQTGKTTELKQLCWELQECGLYLPIYYEVRTNTELKREDIPYEQYQNGKEIVVVIDALDEVNGKVYNDLLEEIEGYAVVHPEIKMVLSCRSNYRKDNNLLKQFTELYLEELSSDDILERIVKKIGSNNRLYLNLIDKQLIEFAKNPFYLDILIDAYKRNKQLPKSKGEIYRLFIENSYSNEGEKNVLTSVHPLDESLHLLERIALALSMMNKQSLSKSEFFECLNNNENDFKECLRYDLIQCEDGNYSFKHSAFREWLVANYLQRAGLYKAKQLATHPTGRIKQEWYNIIILWLSMLEKDNDIITEVLDWLKVARLELIVHIDKGLLNEEKRNSIFKKILQDYKIKGIRIAYAYPTSRDYTDLLYFGQSNDTVNFIADEISLTTSRTAYYADLMWLCRFMDWNKINGEILNKLLNVLKRKVKEALDSNNPDDLTFVFFGNLFFKQQKYVDELFDIVKDSNYYEAISSMVQLIDKTDKVEDKLYYILEKEKYVCDQKDGFTIHRVSRTSIYNALSKVKTIESVKKVIKHKFNDSIYLSYDSEQKEYIEMMKFVLNRIHSKNNELVDFVVDAFYSNIFKDYNYPFGRNELRQELILLLRNWLRGSYLREKGRKTFSELMTNLNCSNETIKVDKNVVHKTLFVAALWMTTEDVKDAYDSFAANNPIEQYKAQIYIEIPYTEVSEYANLLYNDKFSQNLSSTKWKDKQRQDFNVLADYNSFLQIVLSIIAEFDGNTTRRKFVDTVVKRDNINHYASDFILQYVDNDEDIFNVTTIEIDINNRTLYENFFFQEVSAMMLSNHFNWIVTDDAKDRCVMYAKDCITSVCEGSSPSSYFETAIKLMLNDYFIIDVDSLYKLLDYSDINIYKTDDKGCYNKFYYLFEYISKKVVDFEKFNSLVINKLQEIIDNEKKTLLTLYSIYVIENNIEEGYSLATKFALTPDYDVLELMIKKKIELEEIKIGISEMEPSCKLICYKLLLDNANENKWVKQQLELEYQSFDEKQLRRGIEILLRVGSVNALNYLDEHPELMSECDDLIFNFDSPKAIPSLCNLIKYSKDIINAHTSIFTSLNKITMNDIDSLIEIKSQLSSLLDDNKYKYLNKFIEQLEEKYYTLHSGLKNIENVLKIIDSNPKDCVYISYKWDDVSFWFVRSFCNSLEDNGIPYKRDMKDCNYNDNIKDFMDEIREAKKVVVVFSELYLKSLYCMYELSGIFKHPDYRKRIVPIMINRDVKNDSVYDNISDYWNNELYKTSEGNVLPSKQDIIKEICEQLREIMEYIRWTNMSNLKDLSASNFEPIINIIRDKDRLESLDDEDNHPDCFKERNDTTDKNTDTLWRRIKLIVGSLWCKIRGALCNN